MATLEQLMYSRYPVYYDIRPSDYGPYGDQTVAYDDQFMAPVVVEPSIYPHVVESIPFNSNPYNFPNPIEMPMAIPQSQLEQWVAEDKALKSGKLRAGGGASAAASILTRQPVQPVQRMPAPWVPPDSQLDFTRNRKVEIEPPSDTPPAIQSKSLWDTILDAFRSRARVIGGLNLWR